MCWCTLDFNKIALHLMKFRKNRVYVLARTNISHSAPVMSTRLWSFKTHPHLTNIAGSLWLLL